MVNREKPWKTVKDPKNNVRFAAILSKNAGHSSQKCGTFMTIRHAAYREASPENHVHPPLAPQNINRQTTKY